MDVDAEPPLKDLGLRGDEDWDPERKSAQGTGSARECIPVRGARIVEVLIQESTVNKPTTTP